MRNRQRQRQRQRRGEKYGNKKIKCTGENRDLDARRLNVREGIPQSPEDALLWRLSVLVAPPRGCAAPRFCSSICFLPFAATAKALRRFSRRHRGIFNGFSCLNSGMRASHRPVLHPSSSSASDPSRGLVSPSPPKCQGGKGATMGRT
jgi:hypothetical protein